MDEPTARQYLHLGLQRITANQKHWRRRQDYFEGKQDLPFAPEGVNVEYLSLREQAVSNWLGLALRTPAQRLRADGFRTGRTEDADRATWNEVWQPNKLDSRQGIAYTQMLIHGRGIMSCWPNQAMPRTPTIRPESGERVHLEPDPEDPFSTLWVVKAITVDDYSPEAAQLVIPGSTTRSVAWVYDATNWMRFEKGGRTLSADWKLFAGGPHPFGEPPFVAFDNRPDADGKPQPGIDPLIPAQDAINTIRFNALLAMQFSAYRQRVFTGYDPVIRDEDGEPVWRTNADATLMLDAQGQKVPLLRSPGRLSVDRALVLPGADTRVFDLPESNLNNYITVLSEFLSHLFAVAQVPPQYLLNKMANLSGDALAGAESTLQSLVSELKLSVGESLEHLMRLANRARGDAAGDLASEVIWADTEARSFAQIVDGIVKLTTTGFPSQAAWELIPGATPQKVDRWMQMQADERGAVAASDPIARAAEAFRTVPAPPVTSDAVEA